MEKKRSMFQILLFVSFTFLILSFFTNNKKNEQTGQPSPGGVTSQSAVNVTSLSAVVVNNVNVPAGDAYIFISRWGVKGTKDGQFSHPFGINTDSSNNVYIADSTNNRIEKFDSSGFFIAKYGTPAPAYGGDTKKDGHLYTPTDIIVDKGGFMYIVDWGNERIQKFDSAGNFVTKWGSHGTGDGQFNHLWGITMDKDENIYVSDSCNHRIEKFDSSGKYITKWGIEGNGNGQFKYPNGITVDETGNVYVADSNNQRIQKFDSQGNFISKWGTKGTGNGQFWDPYGVAVDKSGNVYVTEFINKRVQKFDSQGNFITKIDADTANAPLFNQGWKFNLLAGVTVDLDGNLYVVDRQSASINKFAPKK